MTPKQAKLNELQKFAIEYEELLKKYPNVTLGITIHEALVAYDSTLDWANRVSINYTAPNNSK